MSRLTGFLEEYEVKELDANAYKNAQAFYEETKHFNAHVLVGKSGCFFFLCYCSLSCLGIHLLRSGSLILSPEFQVPAVLILGGTDVNEHSKQPEKLQLMQQVVSVL
jgi:hypothetical protein